MILLEAGIDAQMHATQLALYLGPPSASYLSATDNTLALPMGTLRPVAGWVQALLAWDVWLHVSAR